MKGLLLPPFGFFTCAALALAAAFWLKQRRLKQLGFVLLAAAYVSCLAPTSHFLRKTLEIAPPLTPPRLEALMQSDAPPQAIVILSAGEQANTAHLGGTAPDGATLERMHFGARLARRSELPVLVTGGKLSSESRAIADLMAETMEADFGIPVTWRETRAGNTYQNAQFSADLLKRDGIDRVLVVTHSWHQRRAVWSFEQQDITAIPAPLSTVGIYHFDLEDLLPNAFAMQAAYYGFHEWTGNLWYRVRYR